MPQHSWNTMMQCYKFIAKHNPSVFLFKTLFYEVGTMQKKLVYLTLAQLNSIKMLVANFPVTKQQQQQLSKVCLLTVVTRLCTL